MPVQSIQTNEFRRNPSYLSNVVNATVAGSLLGAASMYVLPLTQEEAADIHHNIIETNSRKMANQKIVTKLNNGANFSQAAKDEFIKLVDPPKKTSFTEENIKTIRNKLTGKDLADFDGIMKKADDMFAGIKRNQTIIAKLEKKHYSRSKVALPFILAGASLGFIAGVCKNVFRTNIDNVAV